MNKLQSDHYKLAGKILGRAIKCDAVQGSRAFQEQLKEKSQEVLLSEEYKLGMLEVLAKNYYFKNKEEILKSAELTKDLEDHIQNRYVGTLNHYIPWIENVIDLHNCELVEIGAGTGSSSAAFSKIVKKIHAYEISENSTRIARRRIQLLGIDNVSIYQYSSDKLLHKVQQRHGLGSVSAVLLFAVLEHMTVYERLETLKTAWNLLKPGGILIVAETPNRLTYHDHHTTWLPFFHMLPQELAISYIESIPRETIKQYLKSIARLNIEKRIEALTRLGNAVSFHEFEIAFQDNLENLIIADGDFTSIRSLYPVTKEEDILRQYFTSTNIPTPISHFKV